MRNITRSNYTPKTGDYHNMIVHDPVLGKIWLFDCDGVFLDMSKTNIIVVNEAGDSDTYAISQQFVTNAITDLNAIINSVDTSAQNRDTTLQNNLDEAVETLNTNIAQVNTDAITRETQLAAAINAHVDTLDNDIENLTAITNSLTSRVSTINQTAVFDVHLEQSTDVALSVTDGTQTTRTVLREASATQNGLMPAATYTQVQENADAIQRLQNSGLYRGSFDVLADAPTITPDSAFIGGEIYNNDFISVQNASHEGQTGIGRYRAIVENGNVTYAFEAFIDRDIANFSDGNAGLIVGSTTDGKVGAASDGTGEVNGWGTVKADIATNAQNISANASDIATLQSTTATHTSEISALDGRVTTAEGNISAVQSDVAQLSSDVATASQAVTTLENKGVQAATDTTLGANTENLLTVAGMMRQWVDISTSGLPADPDANTFYYTVEN